MKSNFIVRQAIYDEKLNVYAYQLLSQRHTSNGDVLTDEKSTTNVILNTLTQVGTPQLVGNHPVFINFTYDILIGKQQIPELPKQIAIEISEEVEVTEELINNVNNLSKSGHPIALDDFSYREDILPLVEIADIVKIDISKINKKTLQQQLVKLQKNNVRFLAKNIETQKTYEFCKELGFDYFQGDFFYEPKLVESQRAPANKITIMNLLAQLQDPNVKIEKIEELISQDLALSYRLLKYINSAAFSMQREVDSIHQAIVMLGLNTIRSLANLMLMSKFNDKPHDLLVIAIIRARMCEELASYLAPKIKDTFFTVGLFSIIDALMDDSIENIVSQLPLSTSIKDALLKYEGIIGETLKCCIAFEQADWKNVHIDTIDEMTIQKAYFNAVIWSNEATTLVEK